MTCIVGVTDGENVVIGGDSAGSSPEGNELYNLRNEKVFSQGEYLIGYCASYRGGQIARWQVEWPAPPPPGTDLEAFLVREVVPALRSAFTQGGLDKPAQFLIGLRGRLFSIGGDWSAAELAENWIAIGSGRHIAYGALHALATTTIPTEEKVRLALAAAQRYTSNVREPFLVLATKTANASANASADASADAAG